MPGLVRALGDRGKILEVIIKKNRLKNGWMICLTFFIGLKPFRSIRTITGPNQVVGDKVTLIAMLGAIAVSCRHLQFRQ